jgi:hypothetical protein
LRTSRSAAGSLISAPKFKVKI